MNTSDKLLATLALFTTEEPEWTVEDAASRLDLSVSTTYRYFRSLNDAGLIVAPATGRYVLGPAIVQLDRQVRLRDPLIKAARPIMRELAERCAVPAMFLLCRLYRNQVMCVHQEQGGTLLDSDVAYERGRLLTLHRGAASKIILAGLPARFVRGYQGRNREDMAAVGFGPDWEEVKRSLRQLRSAGISVTYGELDPGMLGIAAPLFDPAGNVMGSLGKVVEDNAETTQALPQLKDDIREAAERITRAIATWQAPQP